MQVHSVLVILLLKTTENKNSIVSTADNSTPDKPITEVTSSPTEFSTESSTEQTTVSTTNTTSSSTIESSTEPTDIKVISIKLNKVNCTIYNNQKVQLKAIVNPINAINKKVSWVSSNSQIATVDRNGKVKALKVGNAIITAISTDGSNVSAKCKIKVVQRVTKVKLNKSVVNLSKKGKTAKLKATVYPN